ncbi:vasotab [Teleopsis dalmanni]|uniref:vasotab n=1 Tax=Teleopsis dalmanni TaxID=139649 RepID=UPI0018CE9205|nr:vasotab [Teleopsis dalmanni]
MRFTLCALLVLCLVAVAFSIPAKDNKKQAPTCSKDCGDKYDPLCAKAKTGTKERLLTFGSPCVMDNYNCAHSDDQFEKKSNGECPGNVSVRLS